MSDFGVIVDTVADIPPSLMEKYNFELVPAYIVFPDTDEILKDKIDITQEEYFRRLESTKKHPFTTQPSPNEFLSIFKKLESEGTEEILYVPVSSKLSGLYSNAHLAKKKFERDGGKAKIAIHDSKQASMGVGIQAVKAATLFDSGQKLDEVLPKLELFRLNQLKSTLVVQTLKYLMKGGRISKIQYAIGTILGFTPCLEGTYEGFLESFDKSRGYSEGIAKVIDKSYHDIKEKENLAAYIIEGKANEGVQIATNYFKTTYPDVKILEILPLGSSIYTHTGPGVVAIILFKNFSY